MDKSTRTALAMEASIPGAPARAGLLEGCRAGDRGSWHRLFRERADQIYRWEVLLGLSPADAEDAAQEVLAVAARRICDCRTEEGLAAWLFQIARRVAANARRRAWWRKVFWPGRARPEAPEPAFEHSDSRDVELEHAVRATLARLPEAQAAALVLVEVEGYTREEAASALGIRPGTVASRVRLARQAFSRHWQGPPGEQDPRAGR